MKLLIITQIVDRNDSNLGFFHRWIEEFSKHCETVTVICLKEGDHALPSNVRVFSLGKENGKASRLQYAMRFWKLIWQERKNYDAVFVHMNVEYVVLGGIFWRLWHKRIGLWYLHKSVTWKLRVANLLTHEVFTGTKESFRLPSKKIHIMGQGIDVKAFSKMPHEGPSVFTIIFVGRLSPIKGVDILIDAAHLLKQKGLSFKLQIIGGAETPDQIAYAKSLHERVEKYDLTQEVTFVGPIPNHELPAYLSKASVFVNTGRTGSLDKAGIEPMAVGLPVVSCNDSYRAILEPYYLYFKEGDIQGLADILMRLADDISERSASGAALKQEAFAHHNLETLVPRILSLLAKDPSQ
jgi:glycosyltransferase involved in cell wall biosynthesis